MDLLEFMMETRYLVLSGSRKHDAIYNRIGYLISLKNSITYVISHYNAKIKVDFYDSLPIEKTLALHNVIYPLNQFLIKNKITTIITHF